MKSFSFFSLKISLDLEKDKRGVKLLFLFFLSMC